MDSFFIEYRDPMFGLIILFLAVFIISFVNYWWGAFKSKEERYGIEQFIKKFEIVSDEDEYKKLLKDHTLPAESLALLAHAYTKSGDFEKAIGLYLIILERTNEKKKKEFILSELGKTYFKAGFLRRSADIFLESLRLHPRNTESLKYLTVTYEKLKEFDKAIEVLDSLEELGAKVTKQRSYLKTLKIKYSYHLSDEQKIAELKEIIKDAPFLQRKYFELLKLSHKPIALEELESLEMHSFLDLLWFEDFSFIDFRSTNHPLLKEILAAKGLAKKDTFEYFAFEVLSKLSQAGYHKAGVNFEYMCGECKHTFPMHFTRCPNCHTIGSEKIQPILAKEKHEENISFL